MTLDSRSEYARRMHRVLAHIDQQLDQALDLNTLAEVAHFSPFHFHRVFAAWMGETMGDYLRRRRLEVAAMRLAAQPRVPVLNIALAVGFGSAEAFARAFRGRFGCSPTAWRSAQTHQRLVDRNPDQTDSNSSQAAPPGLVDAGVSHSSASEVNMVNMNVQVIDRAPVTVAYLRHSGAYGKSVTDFWRNSYYPWALANNLLTVPRYGISHDDPGVTAPEQCRYDACAEVSADFVATGGAFTSTIPGGRYAVLRFKGNDPGSAWAALLRDWLPGSGMQLDARPMFEHYPIDASYDAQTGSFECDICVPVVPM